MVRRRIPPVSRCTISSALKLLDKDPDDEDEDKDDNQRRDGRDQDRCKRRSVRLVRLKE